MPGNVQKGSSLRGDAMSGAESIFRVNQAPWIGGLLSTPLNVAARAYFALAKRGSEDRPALLFAVHSSKGRWPSLVSTEAQEQQVLDIYVACSFLKGLSG